VGGIYFRNSFNQPCGYVFGQKSYTWGGGDDGLFLKITAGILYGYKPPHDHSVPFNVKGFAPGFLPIVGYKYGRVTAEFTIFGAASGFAAALGYDIWR
jgi:hypothetical protein